MVSYVYVNQGGNINMLRIIVGQDPYPEKSKQLHVSNYPCSPVAFYQPSWDKQEKTFHRVVEIIHSKGVPYSLNPVQDVSNLANKGLFLMNAYKGHVVYDEKTILIGPNKNEIISFAEQYRTCFKIPCEKVHFLLCGNEAYNLMYSEIVKHGFKAYRAPHPSNRNPGKSVEIFWDKKINTHGKYYIDNQTVKNYFQID